MKPTFGGYGGTTLHVDLSKQKIVRKETEDELIKKFVGGRGFSSKVLFDSVGPQTEPLSPENVLIWAVGPLTGTLAPCAARMTLAAKSPLTGVFGDSNIGGHFPAELKLAGYDLIVFKGRADRPIYIWINEDEVEVRNGKALRGKEIPETENIVKEELGDVSIKVAAIGPAGENLVRFANIMSGGHAAGRTGMGAVMGSKNLKAVAVRGTGKVEVNDMERLLKARDEFIGVIESDPYPAKLVRNYGTPMWVDMTQGVVGICNFSRSNLEGLEKISAIKLKEKYAKKMLGCFNCPIRCDVYCEITEGEFAGTKTEVEYMGFTKFGLLCGNTNMEAIIKCYELCNRYGMDVTNTSLEFAMECYEKGLLTKKDTGGLDLSWGNYKSMLTLIEQTAFREGFGNVLADGVLKAAQKIGRGAEKYAMHVKGMNIVSEDPRAQKYYALRYIVSPRGGDHLRAQNPEGWFMDFGGKTGGREHIAKKLIWYENFDAFQDMNGVCRFGYCTFTTWPESVEMKFKLLIELHNAATGIEMTEVDAIKAANRVNTIERMFNAREGLTKKDDSFPDRFFEPMPGGPSRGNIADPSPVWLCYYKLRGYDENTGNPTAETLKSLELDVPQN